jgi:hypothetical protein
MPNFLAIARTIMRGLYERCTRAATTAIMTPEAVRFFCGASEAAAPFFTPQKNQIIYRATVILTGGSRSPAAYGFS